MTERTTVLLEDPQDLVRFQTFIVSHTMGSCAGVVPEKDKPFKLEVPCSIAFLTSALNEAKMPFTAADNDNQVVIHALPEVHA